MPRAARAALRPALAAAEGVQRAGDIYGCYMLLRCGDASLESLKDFSIGRSRSGHWKRKGQQWPLELFENAAEPALPKDWSFAGFFET